MGGEDLTSSLDLIHTCYCPRCRDLIDVVVADWDPATKKTEERHPFDRTCDRCGQTGLTLWKRGGPCPQCGGTIDKTGIAAVWD